MQNYYEMLGLDINASLDDIQSKINDAKQNNSIDEALLRQISSILLNEKLKKTYDEKLFDFILNQSSKNFKQDNNSNKIIETMFSKLDDNSGLDNKFVYIVLLLMVVCMVCIFLPITIGNVINFIAGVAMLILLIQDWNILKTVGKNTFSKWWAIIPPVYLFKRARRLETKQTYFQIYMGLWLGFLLLYFIFVGSKIMLEKSACETVTDIIHNQLRQSTSCESVTIINNNGKYHSAAAELSNGRTINIDITETDNGKVYVEINP